MKLSIVQICCFSLLGISHVVNGRPQTIPNLQLSRDNTVRDNVLPKHLSVPYKDQHEHDSILGDIEKRARGRTRPQRKPSSGSSQGSSPDRPHPATPEIPEHASGSGSDNSPLKDKGKGKLPAGSRPASSERHRSKSPDNSKSKAAGKRPVNQTKKKKIIYLGICGTKEKGKPLKNEKPSSKSPPARRPLRSGRTGQSGASEGSKSVKGKGKAGETATGSGTQKPKGDKALAVCKSRRHEVAMQFPKYPTSGDVIRTPELKKKIIAFNAADPDPCNDEYVFGRRPPPRDINHDDGKELWSPRGLDIWTTEHTLDGQIVQSFFLDRFERESKIGKRISLKSLPSQWRTGADDPKELETKPGRCKYLEQFWKVRFQKQQGVSVPEANAMTYLLEVFPGMNEHLAEFTLLPQRLNTKKQALFSSFPGGKDVIAANKFDRYSFHAKIDELRDLVLLQKVHPHVMHTV